jgi:hypothetical protein
MSELSEPGGLGGHPPGTLDLHPLAHFCRIVMLSVKQSQTKANTSQGTRRTELSNAGFASLGLWYA